MSAQNQELVAVWMGASYTFGNGDDDSRVEIGDIRLANGEFERAKIKCRENELIESVSYRLFGRFLNHPKYGKQFIANSFIEEKPIDEESVIAYLTQCRSPARGSITKRVAVALYEQFGQQSIDIVMADPAGASERIRQWDTRKAALAAEYLRGQDHKRVGKLGLIQLFDGRGFPRSSVDNALKAWGIKAAECIREYPYLLMELPGIGFKGADKLYCELSREECGDDHAAYRQKLASIHRQGLTAWYEVVSNRDGSTWFPLGLAKAAVRRDIGGETADPDAAIRWTVNEGNLVTRIDNDSEWVACARHALHEHEIAEFLCEDDWSHIDWPPIEEIAEKAPDDKPLSEHQLDGIRKALTNRVGCLQGSPGVGKTFSVACIVKAIVMQHGEDSIGICCPTGKAAVRAGQAMHDNGVEIDVKTVHRMLGVVSGGSDGRWSFSHCEDNPLPHRFVVVDESSMLDCSLMASLLRACTADTHILFVGDINQLAPVGHGRPFEDMQKLVQTGHLTEIRRNSGRIVKVCAEIRDHSVFRPSEELDVEEGENLPLIQTSTPEGQIQAMESVFDRVMRLDVDPVWDVQVVTALNERSEISRTPLNNLLQGMFNADGVSVFGNRFRVNDKVVCLSNGKYQDAAERSVEHFVANGELARVTALEPGRMWLQLSDPVRSIFVPHAIKHDLVSGETNNSNDKTSEDGGSLRDWDLGYALSVHRSQGSQWKYVIVMVDSSGSARMVQSKNWIYTAISRAEIATFTIGDISVCQKMMQKNGTSDRKTFLVERTELQRLVRRVNYEQLFAEV